MAVALGFIVFGAGLSMVYVGYKGISIDQFWQTLLTGKTPAAAPTGTQGPVGTQTKTPVSTSKNVPGSGVLSGPVTSTAQLFSNGG